MRGLSAIADQVVLLSRMRPIPLQGTLKTEVERARLAVRAFAGHCEGCEGKDTAPSRQGARRLSHAGPAGLALVFVGEVCARKLA